MTARRKSARLAMAVSSVLATPAMIAGFGAVAALAVAPLAEAQQTSTEISGVVVDAGGAPLAGANVVVVHVPSGTTSTAVSNASGQFTATGLRVGGPFTVTASAEGFQGAAVENVYTEIGRRATITLAVSPTVQLAEIEVTGAAERSRAVGVATDFNADQIASVASINRDPKSTLQIDPKAWVDPSNSDAIEVGGTNNRYNTFTVDGVRQSDDFGLENNGYPTLRSPVSIDAVQSLSLLTAPFDVQYSSFRGSTINVVTKSGTNEFTGSAFYYDYDDSRAGSKTRDTEFNLDFQRETYGGTLGGPIIPDKLFFFVSYEKLDESFPQNFGPLDSGFANEIGGTTLAEFEQILQITQNVYGFDPGGLPTSLPQDDEKILAKIDWNISDAHRASLAYQRTEGGRVTTQNQNTTQRQVSASSNWYNETIALDSYSLQLYSDWTPMLSTELKVARKTVDKGQISLNGIDFAQMRIRTAAGGEVFVGPDVFRHANALTNDLDQIKLKADLFLGDHTLTAGYEREMLDVFNLFVPRSEGEYYFNSIADYQNRVASRLRYSNAFTNDKNDGAAAFAYNIDSVYIQDRWQITPDFELQYGLRYDTYSSSDKPLFNQNFLDRYGFSNQETLDGRDLLMPRLGFNWQITDDTLLRGGVGLFGGGSPNVWVSNSYTNNGLIIDEQDIRRPTTGPNAGIEPLLDNVDGFEIPAGVLALQEPGDGPVNAMTRDFEIPSQWKFNLGLEHFFADEWRVSTDLIYSRVVDEVVWTDFRLQQTATAPDGRPIYSPLVDGRSSSTQDIVLGNTSQGRGLVWTIDLSKSWQTRAGTFDVFAGYGYQNVDDVSSGTSSTASSNWDRQATADPNNLELSISNYEIKHRFTTAINWRKAFFGDALTSAGLYFERRSGRPYSYTFGRGTTVFGDPGNTNRGRQLLYVPEVNDPLVTYSSPAFQASVNELIEQSELRKYRGKIAPRNAFNSPWVTLLNLRLAQEIPLGFKETKAVLTFDIENLANLINSDWGQFSQVPFGYVASVLEADINTQGQYVYRPISTSNPVAQGPRRTVFETSVWRMQLGFRIEF